MRVIVLMREPRNGRSLELLLAIIILAVVWFVPLFYKLRREEAAKLVRVHFVEKVFVSRFTIRRINEWMERRKMFINPILLLLFPIFEKRRIRRRHESSLMSSLNAFGFEVGIGIRGKWKKEHISAI